MAGKCSRCGHPVMLGDALYLGERYAYRTEIETSFDPIGNRRLLLQFALHWLLYWVVYLLGGTVAALVLGIGAFAGLGFGAAVTLWYAGAIIVGFAFAFVFWLVPVPVQLSEWKFFVDGKGPSAHVVFDHVAWALRRRQTPLDMVRLPDRGHRDQRLRAGDHGCDHILRQPPAPGAERDRHGCTDWYITLFLRRYGGSYVLATAPAGYHSSYSAC